MRLAALALLSACFPPDADGDGALIPADCDDGNAEVFPGAGETCGNGVDDDCDETATGCGPAGRMSVDDANARIVGDGQYGEGWAIRAMLGPGDIDGDGVSDVVVGAPGDYRERGAVFVIAGPIVGTLEIAGREPTYQGEHRIGVGREFAAGDVTGDGTADLVISAGYDHDNRGHIVVLEGPVSMPTADVVMDVSFDGYYASGIAAAGDVTGDGVGDILVGSPSIFDPEGKGSVWILPGGTIGKNNLVDVGFALTGEAAGDGAGRSVATGDINADGVPDVIMGGATTDRGGVAYIVLGPVTEGRALVDADIRIEGAYGESEVGSGLAAGDADGDGYDDVLASGFEEDDYHADRMGYAAVAWLFSGPMERGGWTGRATATFRGTPGFEEPSNVPSGVAFAGDVDGDGKEDLLFGFHAACWRLGCTVLVRGVPDGIIDLAEADTVIVGEEEAGGGSAAAGAGDLDGDGFSDILVGGWYANRNGGVVSVIGGGPGF